MNTEIVKVVGREILDSRGNPTVEADVYLADGSMGRAAVPSGRIDRRARSGRAARRRQDALPRQGHAEGRQERQQRDRPGAAGHGCDRRRPRSTQRMIDARRHAQQGQARRQRHPRRFDGRRARRGRFPEDRRSIATSAAPARCVLPVPMMNILNGGAHADNSVDLQEFMIVPYGAPKFSEALRAGRRDLPHPEGRAEEERLLHRRRRRGRLCPQPEVERRSARSSSSKPSPRPATSPASRSASRSTPPPASSTTRTRRSTFSRSPTRASAPASRWSSSGPNWVRQYPIVSIEDGMAEDDWEGWKLLTEALGTKIQLVGDDLFVTNTERLSPRHRGRHRQLDPDQGEPDRHAHRDARRHADGGRRRLHRRSFRTAPARPKTPSSPTSPSPPTPARSRPVRPAAPIASPSTTSCSASRKSSARRRSTPGKSALRQKA